MVSKTSIEIILRVKWGLTTNRFNIGHSDYSESAKASTSKIIMTQMGNEVPKANNICPAALPNDATIITHLKNTPTI